MPTEMPHQISPQKPAQIPAQIPAQPPPKTSQVLRLGEFDLNELTALLARFDLKLETCADGESIPGSYWGDDEAGLRANHLYARADTPVHSILHEACHYICVSSARRQNLDTNAGSDNAEENAVCYLQILLAGQLIGMGSKRIFIDMDIWGYSFRLGSSQAWFDNDADDALEWLCLRGIVDRQARLTWCLRKD